MTVTLNAKAFRSAQMATDSKHATRQYLTGVCVQTTGRITASDGCILYACTPNDDAPEGATKAFDQDRIVRVDGRIPAGATWVAFNTETMTCTTDNGKAYTFRFIEGDFPDMDRIIPDLPRRTPPAEEIGLSNKYLATVGAMANGPVRLYAGPATDPVLFTSTLPGDGAEETVVLMPIRI